MLEFPYDYPSRPPYAPHRRRGNSAAAWVAVAAIAVLLVVHVLRWM